LSASPKEKRGCYTALKTAELRVTYRLLNILQAPFGLLFWMIEQRKGRLMDELQRRRT
jgi:hypothetical protein